MLFITHGKGKRRDKVPKRQMTQEKSLRLREFQNWQSNRVVKEFNATKTGSTLQARIDKWLTDCKRLKKEKPVIWNVQTEVIQKAIAAKRIEYIEELIKFLRKQKGVYKSTIEFFEQQLQEFKDGMA